MKEPNLIFPKGFWLGSATSGPQTESLLGRAKHGYDKIYEQSPHRFYRMQLGANDLQNNVTKYVDLAAQAGFNTLRTSIMWTRFMPDGKTVNSEALKFYRHYFSLLRAKNIRPFIVLNHFDLPLLYADDGGWQNPQTIEAFVNYAREAFLAFGDLVDTWFTYCEPAVQANGGYLQEYQYPNKIDMRGAMHVKFNMVIAHLKVVNLYKSLNQGGAIGIQLDINPVYPRSEHPNDVKAAKWAELFQSNVFLDPIFKREYPQVILAEAKKHGFAWPISEADLKLIATAETTDLLGVNYYSPLRVKAHDFVPNWEGGVVTPSYYYAEYIWPARVMNESRGWEIYAHGLYDVLKRVQNDYGNIKTYVSENGMGVHGEDDFRDANGMIIDDYRISFISQHLAAIKKALDEGANVHGYHMWTYIDNWSWLNAYKNRYGIFELNLVTKEIRAKKSALWMRDLIAQQPKDAAVKLAKPATAKAPSSRAKTTKAK